MDSLYIAERDIYSGQPATKSESNREGKNGTSVYMRRGIRVNDGFFCSSLLFFAVARKVVCRMGAIVWILRIALFEVKAHGNVLDAYRRCWCC